LRNKANFFNGYKDSFGAGNQTVLLPMGGICGGTASDGGVNWLVWLERMIELAEDALKGR
jgi:hypothetical protein